MVTRCRARIEISEPIWINGQIIINYIYFRSAWTDSQLVERWKMMIWLIIIWLIISVFLATRAVVLGRGPGNSLVTMKVTPDYFHKKWKKSRTTTNPKLFDSRFTCCIYPETWNLSDSPGQIITSNSVND